MPTLFPVVSFSGGYLVMCRCAVDDCGASSFSSLSLNCPYSDFFVSVFFGRSEYTYFFRRKVSASRILQVPVPYSLNFFKNFLSSVPANKNFS